MSERSLQNNGLKLPYRDLASEVTRRRFTMASREEMFAKKPEEAGVMLFDLDLDQVPPQGMADSPVPPAPPPSPAEDPQVS
ncbi:myocilin opposite strand protein [Desmodus rotundus]|uniref:myocilin opposite strand protein n=1 Tax=Desmodus rotundus TaxID=9430 RepID=UPI001E1C134A|nr:myocilin opposite strand protein [Desmodus rotundus]